MAAFEQRQVCPDLAKFPRYGKKIKSLKISKSLVVFRKILKLLWQISNALSQISIVVYGQILKYNLTI